MKTQFKICTGVLPWLIAGVSLLIPATASAAKDACTLVTSAEAEAALGEPVGPPRSETRPTPGGEGSVCKFRSTARGKSLSVNVHYSSTDLSGRAAGIKDNLKAAGYSNVHDVAGVGDSAVWGTNSVLGKPVGELTVLKGKAVMLVIIINGLPDSDSALDRAKALAAKVLPRT
jgi:hypothetical protein